MANLSTNQKAAYIFAMLAVVIFTGFAAFKANRMASIYDAGSKSIQTKIGDTAAKIRSGDLELTDEKLAIILETSADRKLEDGVVKWFKKYLLLFVFLFGGSMLFLLFRELKRANSTNAGRPH